MYKTNGRHLIADFWDCREKIKNNNKIIAVLKKAAKTAGSIIVGEKSFKFKPQGITAVILLQESHISCHTYPEYNFMAVDIYTCGLQTNPQKALDYLKREFKPGRIKSWLIKRG